MGVFAFAYPLDGSVLDEHEGSENYFGFGAKSPESVRAMAGSLFRQFVIAGTVGRVLCGLLILSPPPYPVWDAASGPNSASPKR